MDGWKFSLNNKHKSVDPSCFVSMIQVDADGVIMLGIFSWHALNPLVPFEHYLNVTAYLSTYADCVRPIIATV